MKSGFNKYVPLGSAVVFALIVTGNAFADVKKNSILDAFKLCDAAALKGKSGMISKSVIVKKIVVTSKKGEGTIVKLVYTKGYENSFQTIKDETGYDFYDAQTGVLFQRQEADGIDNYATCELIRK
jgi:hypothetical protein